MYRAFEGFSEGIRIVSVSPWLEERARRSPILAGKLHMTVKNGVNTEIFRPSASKGAGDGKTVFHATAFFSDDPDHPKGGYYLLRLARAMEGDGVHFVVAGKHSRIEDLPGNVTLLGEIGDQKRLAELYSAADVTLLTSKRETFSMVAVESLCCGTPVVGFRAGAPEGIALEPYSSFVDFGNVDGLKSATEMIIASKIDPEEIAKAARDAYGKDIMYGRYLEIYKDLVKEENGEQAEI